MTIDEKKRFREAFFQEAGPNLLTLKAMLDTLPDVAFYIKDIQQRIVVLNRRNCEICNIKDEFDAVGLRSDELFPNVQATAYMTADRTVIETGEPIVNALSAYPADKSANFTSKCVYPIVGKSGQIIGTTCLYRLIPNPETVPSWHGRVKAATLYIHENYRETITLELLAELVKTSVSKFSRMFTQTLNVSPGRYITDIRITSARKLLEESDKTIADIAQETGFCDHSHFVKTFRRIRGITPGEYRRKHHLALATSRELPKSAQ